MARDTAVVVCVAGWAWAMGVEAGGDGDGDGEAVHTCRSLDAQPAHSGACTVLCVCLALVCTVLHSYFWRNAASSACSPAVVTPVCLSSRALRRLADSAASIMVAGMLEAPGVLPITCRPSTHRR